MKSKKLISPLISLVVLAGLLILTVVLYINKSAAWFSMNKRVEAVGMSVTAFGKYDVELSIKGDSAFEDILPGDTRTTTISVKNNESFSLNLSLGMKAPDDTTDKAYIEGSAYHYLGTQIRLNSIKAGATDHMSLSGKNRYLLPLADELYTAKDGDLLPPTSISSAFNFATLSDRTISDTINLAGNSASTDIALTFEFVDNGELQNAYASFGTSNLAGKTTPLQREIYCIISE